MRKVWHLPLEERTSLGTTYHILTFRSDEPLVVAPGQFTMVRGEWGGSPLLPRPMSLLTGGTRPSILIKVVGQGTERLSLADVGEVFHLLAPLGTPFSDALPDHLPVLVAGGVGVAPLLHLAQTWASRGPRLTPIALYGGRTENDLPLHSELAKVAELRIATEDGSRGTRGRVTALLERLLEEARTHGTRLHIFTCGPERMMAAVATMAEREGIPCEVSLETPMACGYGVCLGCPVPARAGGMLYACTAGPCVSAERVQWSALLEKQV